MMFLGLVVVGALLSAGVGRLVGRGESDLAGSMRHGLTLGLLFVGVDHLVTPARYVAMIDGFLPMPHVLVAITGLCELAGAVGLLMPRTRRLAAMALAAYFVAVFPANVANALHGVDIEGLPQANWYYWVRLALQPVFVWWALVAGGWFAFWPARRASIQEFLGVERSRYADVQHLVELWGKSTD